MHSLEDMMNMSKEEFAKNWRNGSIQDASLKLLGARDITEDEKNEIEL